jgi:hypothetical protein
MDMSHEERNNQGGKFSEGATCAFSKREAQHHLSSELESVPRCCERFRRRICTMTIR